MHKALPFNSKHNAENTFFPLWYRDDLRNINGGPVVTLFYSVKDVSHKKYM